MRANDITREGRRLSRWALRALGEQAHWGSFLERYLEALSCSHGHLLMLVPNERGEVHADPCPVLHEHRGYDAHSQRLFGHYMGRQPYRSTRSFLRSGYFFDAERGYREDWERTEFYNDFVREVGYHWSGGQVFLSSPSLHVFVSFMRPRGCTPGADEKRAMAALGPPMTALGRVLAVRRTWEAAPTLVVDPTLQVLWASMSARLAVEGEPALRWGPALRATGPGLGTALEAAVRAAARASVGDAAFASRRLRAGELELLVSPHPRALDTGLPRAEVRIRRRPPPTVEERLRRAFGLSPREAHVALALVREGSMEEVAERIDVTAGTLRTLASRARRKVGARSRAGLARALAPWLDRPGT